MSILDLLRRVARPHDSVLGFVPGLPGMHDIDDYPQAELVPGLVVYRYDAPLCFANAEDFRRRALEAVDADPQPVKWFVLNAEANSRSTLTALDALERLRVELSRRGVLFCDGTCQAGSARRAAVGRPARAHRRRQHLPDAAHRRRRVQTVERRHRRVTARRSSAQTTVNSRPGSAPNRKRRPVTCRGSTRT